MTLVIYLIHLSYLNIKVLISFFHNDIIQLNIHIEVIL